MSTTDERKRLGQYFTGEPLARLLAALGSAHTAASILDPMAGTGDMLLGARAVGAEGAAMTAVEIDPRASRVCGERMGVLGHRACVRTANAFEPSTWTPMAKEAWDLVITNPPYVRYQHTAAAASGRLTIPSSTEVRRGLKEIIERRATLSDAERHGLIALTAGYSGFADLAVPSWLLCAALVAPGGRLAMVVPDTWLSRDYALPILYMLRRYFELEFVIEDGDASWFEDAQVRTTLVVARRTPSRPTAFGRATVSRVTARLTSEAADGRSMVGALHPRSREPELRFAERLRGLAGPRRSLRMPGLDARVSDDGEFRDRIRRAHDTSWGRALEPSPVALRAARRSRVAVPGRLREVVGDVRGPALDLEDLGWRVGQGLRTGANRFFYGEAIHVEREVVQIRFDPALSREPIEVPRELLRVVVRKQSDLAAACSNPARSPGRLIFLSRHALDEDLESATCEGVESPYRPIPQPLADAVRAAMGLNVGSIAVPRFIPELSAVRTNVREVNARSRGSVPRFWYHLPPLAPRHTGVLFIPRINHGHPEPTLNRRGVVIDANFSTFWPDGGSLPPLAMYSVLSSTWCRAAFESSGTVLGGGALKLEATQLRRLPLPAPDSETTEVLVRLGEALVRQGVARSANAIHAIDEIVFDSLGITQARRRALLTLCAELLQGRSPRARRVG